MFILSKKTLARDGDEKSFFICLVASTKLFNVIKLYKTIFYEKLFPFSANSRKKIKSSLLQRRYFSLHFAYTPQ